MHATVKSGNSKPCGFKAEMNTNMTIFLAYAPVGNNANTFKPKKNNNKKKGCKGKDDLDTLDPSIYPTFIFSLDVDPNTIVSSVTHEFGCTGGFYFCKKQLQCVETVTPFIIYYLYTLNGITTLHTARDWKATSCSQRSLSIQKSQRSTSGEASQSFLDSQVLNFVIIQGRCRRHDVLIS
jgi:hypothetical protein